MLSPLKLIRRIFKSDSEKELNKLKYLATKINNYENEIKKLRDDQFPIETDELKKKVLPTILPSTVVGFSPK